jgi:hypothetical protein
MKQSGRRHRDLRVWTHAPPAITAIRPNTAAMPTQRPVIECVELDDASATSPTTTGSTAEVADVEELDAAPMIGSTSLSAPEGAADAVVPAAVTPDGDAVTEFAAGDEGS